MRQRFIIRLYSLLSIILPLMAVFLISSCSPSSPTPSLTVYCGAGLHKAATEIGETFEKQHQISIHYNFAGSNTLLSQLQLVKTGDVYIPAARYYQQIAVKKGLMGYNTTIALHIPVIAVPKANPQNIRSLSDLARPGVRVGLGDPKAAAIGKTSVDIFTKNSLLEQIEKNTVTQTATVNELVTFTALAQVDAAITWEDNVISAANKITIIRIPDNQNCIKTIEAGVLTFSKQKKEARLFVDYLKSPEAQRILAKHGFKTEDLP